MKIGNRQAFADFLLSFVTWENDDHHVCFIQKYALADKYLRS